ncbi:glucose-6-phosphate isomerase [Actinoplanes sp. CA-051413]|uniref:glucose-6-phosphate isomerase n=1 Tax=Actinoplanes sp. CA-051413 TaxID=3239899 RepID=UPI003D9665FD
MTDDLLAGVEAAAGFAVHGSPATASRRELVAHGVPGLLAGKDPTLWGPAAEGRALDRLRFLDAYRGGAELLPLIAELHEELGDLSNVVLTGPGRAAGAVARTLGRPLTVLDDPDPHPVRALLDDPALLRRTVVVLADEVLGSVLWQAYRDLGLTAAEAGRHFVVLGGPLPELEAAGAVTVPAEPGALGAATLVPAAFAGVDVAELIDQAELFAPSLAADDDNPALALGVALAAAERILLVPDGSGLELGEWAADLLTGGLGLPVTIAGTPQDAPGDALTVTYGGSLAPAAVLADAAGPMVAVNGPLGAHFLAWPYAVAIAAHVRGVDPFRDFPAEAADPAPAAPSFVEGAVEIFTTGSATDLAGALRELLAEVDDQLRIHAFLDRTGDAEVTRLGPLLSAASGRPAGFGWGSYHRGGPLHGSFLQITGAVTGDVAVPGQERTLGGLQAARAAGDRQALAGRGRPLLHLHLTDRPGGIRQVLTAAEMLRH